jgi:hypothetical protein
MNKLLSRLKELAEKSRHQNAATREIARLIKAYQEDPSKVESELDGLVINIKIASIASLSKDQSPDLRRIEELATRAYLFNAVLGEGRITLDLPCGVDHNDFPEFTDAYFAAGKIQIHPGNWRDLGHEELEIIHKEFPEVINQKINEWYQGA